MKKQLFFTLALFWCNLLSFGQDFTYDGIYYTVTSAVNPLEVSVASNPTPINTVNIPATAVFNGTNYAVTGIGDSAFVYATGLFAVTIPDSVRFIGNYAFFECNNLTSVTIPNSVTSINLAAFYNCTSLTSVNIPDSVSSIGSSAFAGCNGLTSATISNSLSSISYNLFGFCTNLTSVVIPNSVTSISGQAFANCTGLNSVTVNWTTQLPNINPDVFANVTLGNVALNVPSGTAALYDATAVWTDFNIIFPLTATQSQTNVSCFGGDNGTAAVVASGGVAPYSYLWSNGWTFANETDLAAATHSCTITDAQGNTITENFVITEPTQLTATQAQTNVSCFGGTNGSASVVVSGGTTPYTYLWSPNGGANATATGLAAGTYSVWITDANGCTKTESFTIAEPNALPDNVSTISACDSFNWNGTTYDQTGIYVGTTTNCVTEKLDLTITPSYYNNTTRSACDSYTWANNNQTYTQSGTYYGTTTGCGTEKLNLTITPTPIADAPANVTACQVYILPALSPGNKYYSESNGQGIEYVVGANDGITQTSEIYVLARSPFFPFCQTQNSFTVTIIPNTGTATTTNACGSYIWGVNGETYSTSGNYEYVSGCNTSYLNLTINPVISNLTTKTECNSYFWPDNGTTYNETGTYSFNVGCETFILNLTITPSSDNITTETACDSFTWNGQTYNQTGIYVGTTTNCVTEKLNLTITPSSINTTTATAVGFYNWTVTGGDYTATGLYNGTITNCVRQKLDLTILPVTISVTQNNVVLTANTNATNVTYEWFVCATPNNILIPNETNSTFTPTASGSYFCRIKIGGNSEAAYRIASDCFNFTFLANNTFSEIAGLDLYPNPSTGIFNLKLPTDLQIEVYNNLGQLLSSEKMFSGSNVINISDKPVGVYFLKANDGNNVSTFKIIKN